MFCGQWFQKGGCKNLWNPEPMHILTKERNRGQSAVSLDGMIMVATNLFDGINIYSLASNSLQHMVNGTGGSR